MTNRERFFLLLTVVGFVVPNVFVGVFVAEHGVDFGHYLNDWYQTLPAAQLAADLAICVVAFVVWAAWEGARIGERRWWVVIPATGLVGLCFAIPLFLWLRERRLA
jgi:hypothetical protein